MAAKQELMTTTAGQADGQQFKKQSRRTDESLSLHRIVYVMLTVGQSTLSFFMLVLFKFSLYLNLPTFVGIHSTLNIGSVVAYVLTHYKFLCLDRKTH